MKAYDIINASNEEIALYLVVQVLGERHSDTIARCDDADKANIVLAALEMREREFQKENASIKYGVAVEPSISAADQQFDPEPANSVIIEKAGDLTKITIRI